MGGWEAEAGEGRVGHTHTGRSRDNGTQVFLFDDVVGLKGGDIKNLSHFDFFECAKLSFTAFTFDTVCMTQQTGSFAWECKAITR